MSAVSSLKQAVQPQKSLAEMKPSEKIAHLLEARKESIAAMLPRHLNAERLLKVAQIAATTTPSLLECEIPSLISAIGQCAQMGLEPNTVLGHAYLVPFKTKKNDVWVKNVQVIVGYKGLIDLARRSGHIVSIAAHEVYENDTFELEYGLEEKLRHIPSIGKDRGEIIGFYAVAHLKDGGHAFDWMPKAEVDAIKESSQGYQSAKKYKKDHPWISHYVEMGKKTAVRRLSKMLPLSIEFQTAAAMDEAVDRGASAHIEAIAGEFVVVEDQEAEPESAPAAQDDDMGVDVEPIPDFDPELARDDLISLIGEATTKEELKKVSELPVYQRLKAEFPEMFSDVNRAASAALGRVK